MGLADNAAIAKHISEDGCQLILARDDVVKGQRFRFNLAGTAPIIGTVRWVFANRVGFAFDRPLCRASQEALISHCLKVHGLDLFLA